METFKLAKNKNQLFAVPSLKPQNAWFSGENSDALVDKSLPIENDGKNSGSESKDDFRTRAVRSKSTASLKSRLRNSVSDLSTSDTGYKQDEFTINSRPPTRHTYRPRNASRGEQENGNGEGEGGREGGGGSQQWSRPSTGRPRSATSMMFVVDSSTTPRAPAADELIATLKDGNEGNSTDFDRKKKKVIIGLILGSLLLAAIVAGTVVAVAATNSKRTKIKMDDKTTTPTRNASETTAVPTLVPTSERQVLETDEAITVTGNNIATHEATVAHTLTRTTEAQVSTTPTPIVIIEENENITYGGTWSTWGSWSDCSQTCAVGTQNRIRLCETTELQCQGVSEQRRRCNIVLCPIPDAIGIWTTWTGWAACSLSCGGGNQARVRTCVSVNNSSAPSNDCVGDNTQTRGCNDFECPDCGRECEDGTLSGDCSHCICSLTVTGQILSDTNLPLANVTISPRYAANTTFAISTAGGYFEADNICLNEVYLLQKVGFVNTEAIFFDLENNITMETVVPLQMSVNPTNVLSLTGESISFCCESHGNPPPDYYEWMKGAEVVYTEYANGGSVFTIDVTSVNDTGYYRCRASNDLGAIFSSVSTLIVKEVADDFCPSQPVSSIVTLPDGCLYEGAQSIDKGSCGNSPCYGGETHACSFSATHCCGPTTLSRVLIDCQSYTLPVYLVTSCGCSQCRQSNITIFGFAGGRDNTPLASGNIYWNGTLVTNTSSDGTFSFTVQQGLARASVLFVDNINKTFMDSTYVFEMPTNNVDSQYIRVYLLRRGQVNHLNSSEENSVLFNDTAIDIPANSFYTSEGQLYTGEVIATVTTINPNDIDELASAPGDLTMTDEEGDSQPLQTYGMFAMLFEDEDGNRLSIPGEITITVPAETIGNVSDISAIRGWTLNPSTGVWQFASDLNPVPGSEARRKKRQINQGGWGQEEISVTLRGLSIDVKWFNFDAISSQTCIAKVRLFRSDNYVEDNQFHDGQVTVVLEDSNGYKSMSRNRVSTDTRDNGYCMVLPCESHRSNSPAQFEGYVFADYRTEEFVPVDNMNNNGLQSSVHDLNTLLGYEIENNMVKVDFNERLVHNEGLGPFYDYETKWRYSSACSGATFTENHFRFWRNRVCFLREDSYDTIPTDESHSILYHLLLWHDIYSYFPQSPHFPEEREHLFKACYIKILAPVDTKVQAVSEVADTRHPLHNTTNNVYGVREDCATSGAVCLEIRSPGYPRTSAIDFITNFREDKTLISIKVTDRIIPVATHQLAEAFADDVISSNGDVIFQMYLVEEEDYGPETGIYCNHGDTQAVAEQSLYMCRNGNNAATPRDHANQDSWAVEFSSNDGTIRLSNGSFGLIWIYYNGEWGTVCGDYFGMDECRVVCRQLGYVGAISYYYGYYYYYYYYYNWQERMSAPIWLDDLNCSGDESRLQDCPRRNNRDWGEHNCEHWHDAGCECQV